MKLGSTVVAIPGLGLAAALVAHKSLQVCAALGFGAASYGSHEHGAVVPTFCVEAIIFALMLCAGVREAVRKSRAAHYRLPRQMPTLFCAIAIAAFALATLFGMEFFESGNAALGTGWFGGSLLPGIPLIALAIAIAVWAYAMIVSSRNRGFERLVALVVAMLSLAIGTKPAQPRRRSPGRVAIRRTLVCARHAGLRAPPILTL